MHLRWYFRNIYGKEFRWLVTTVAFVLLFTIVRMVAMPFVLFGLYCSNSWRHSALPPWLQVLSTSTLYLPSVLNLWWYFYTMKMCYNFLCGKINRKRHSLSRYLRYSTDTLYDGTRRVVTQVIQVCVCNVRRVSHTHTHTHTHMHIILRLILLEMTFYIFVHYIIYIYFLIYYFVRKICTHMPNTLHILREREREILFVNKSHFDYS